MAVDPLLFLPEEAESIFTELGQLRVELDEDPLAFGPKRLNKKVAEVRRMLDRCERIFLDVSQRMYGTRRALRIAATEIDLTKKSLYANDPETRAGRSVADREAIATGKLAKEMRRMHELDSSALDLEAVLTVVKSKRSDLKDTEGRLKDQVRLCQEEMSLGQHWGSRLHSSDTMTLQAGHPVPDDAKAVADIIASVDGEVHLAKEAGSWEDPPEDEDVTEEPPLPPLPPTRPLTPARPVPATVAPSLPSPDLFPPLESFPLTGTRCSECKEPQYESPSGTVCKNGHGGYPALEEPEGAPELLPEVSSPPAANVALPGTVSSNDADSFLADFSMEEDPKKISKKGSPSPTHMAEPDFLLDFLSEFESSN